MESNVVCRYYSSRQAKLLKEFQSIADGVKQFLTGRYGLEQTQTLIAEATHEYEKLIIERY